MYKYSLFTRCPCIGSGMRPVNAVKDCETCSHPSCQFGRDDSSDAGDIELSEVTAPLSLGLYERKQPLLHHPFINKELLVLRPKAMIGQNNYMNVLSC